MAISSSPPVVGVQQPLNKNSRWGVWLCEFVDQIRYLFEKV
jgi:hypothetical protein